MQRSVTHKVHGRGRSAFPHSQVLLARVLIRRRVGADAGRYAALALLFALGPTACATTSWAPALAKACPLDPGWDHVALDAKEVDALYESLDPAWRMEKHLLPSRDVWSRSKDGNLKLCRSRDLTIHDDQFGACGSTFIQFTKIGGRWAPTDSGETVMCGS